LRQLVPRGYDALRWARILPGLRVVKLDLDDGDYHVVLQRMRAGVKLRATTIAVWKLHRC